MTVTLLGSELPLIAAPMAGGPTTVALAVAVASAGAFPFLAGGYKKPEALAEDIRRMTASGAPFGVNVFVPMDEPVDAAAFHAYVAELQPEADEYGLRLDPVPVSDDDNVDDKLALLVEQPVPVVSFTFGLPGADRIARLRRAGTVVLSSVTTPEEAAAARDAGVDGLVVQGSDAGGHSATFDSARIPQRISTEELTRSIIAATGLPAIAAGGVDGPDAVRRLLRAGALGVAVGTLLLRTDEAGTSATHRAALADPVYDHTVITRAFTGRPARALHNGFIDRHDATAPVGYPAVNHLTRALRQAAGKAGDSDRLHLWAGTGYRNAPDGPAAAVIRTLSVGVDG